MCVHKLVSTPAYRLPSAYEGQRPRPSRKPSGQTVGLTCIQLSTGYVHCTSSGPMHYPFPASLCMRRSCLLTLNSRALTTQLELAPDNSDPAFIACVCRQVYLPHLKHMLDSTKLASSMRQVTAHQSRLPGQGMPGQGTSQIGQSSGTR